MLGHSSGSTATGSLGPMAQGHLMIIGIRDVDLILFSSPEDEHARSAVLLRFPCEQYHTGITNWINNLWENQAFQPIINPSELLPSRFRVSETRNSKPEPSVRTLRPDIMMMASPLKLPVLSATPKQLSRFANPSHLKTGRSESNLRLCGVLAGQLKILLPDGDDEGTFIVPALDARSQVLSNKDRRNGIGKLVFTLAPFGSAQFFFTLVALDLCVRGIPGEVLQWGHLGQCVMAALSPFRFFAAWRVETLFFPRFPFPMGSTLCALFDSPSDRA